MIEHRRLYASSEDSPNEASLSFYDESLIFSTLRMQIENVPSMLNIFPNLIFRYPDIFQLDSLIISKLKINDYGLNYVANPQHFYAM